MKTKRGKEQWLFRIPFYEPNKKTDVQRVNGGLMSEQWESSKWSSDV